MRITIFGAGGKVGRRVVELALVRGHTVVAFVHRHDPFTGSPNLIVKQGDIYVAADVEEAIQDSEAVISCLGSWGTPKRNVLSSAMKSIIPVMEQQGIKRLITLTGTGALAPSESDTTGHKLIMKLTKPFPAGKVFADGEQHMQLLAGSNLDWTTIRSPVMKPGQNNGYRLDLKPGSALATVNREAVATAMLDQLAASDFVQKAPVIHSR